MQVWFRLALASYCNKTHHSTHACRYMCTGPVECNKLWAIWKCDPVERCWQGNDFESKNHDKPSHYPILSAFHGCNLSQSYLQTFCSPIEVFDDFKVPYAGGDLFKSDAPWPWFLVFQWMPFHKSMLDSHSSNLHICCVILFPGLVTAPLWE